MSLLHTVHEIGSHTKTPWIHPGRFHFQCPPPAGLLSLTQQFRTGQADQTKHQSSVSAASAKQKKGAVKTAPFYSVRINQNERPTVSINSVLSNVVFCLRTKVPNVPSPVPAAFL